MKYDLSILIPARNEMFLKNTVEDILKNRRGKTEVIVGLDGQWADPGIEDHPDVKILYEPESIGQRAMTNKLCRMSGAKYIIKCDAHCAFDEGFDVKLMEKMQDDYTMVPIMRNLHAFDWKCMKCGHKRYQGPTPTDCPDCDNKTNFKRKILWFAKPSPQSKSYCFDPEPHFQYFGQYCKTDEFKNDLAETGLTQSMSLQGSFFMLTREKYWELDICNEDFGSWGSQGIEVACKTWLSGGKVMVNHSTWYAHMFRTQGGDFGFPYPQSGRQVESAKKHAKNLFFGGRWALQKHPVSWLVEKFWPVSTWTEADLAALKEMERAK